jgi:putative transposase
MYHPNIVCHIFNQSINFELLFRSEENYRFFLKKVRKLILPFADILCYCLMPDHFHFMIKPKPEGCSPSPTKKVRKEGDPALDEEFQQMLSHQIKTLLSSYTRAYNNRYKRRGSLFRAKTKAKPGYTDFLPEDNDLEADVPFTRLVPYLRVCFRYIHNNPVAAHYALHPTDWEFSSALDYAGLRDGNLCNFALTEHLLGIKRLTP